MGFLKSLTSLGGGSPPPRLPRTSVATADRIRNILGIRELEAMPAQAARAFQLASDSNAKSDDFVSVIESDEGLSARVIRIANSVYFFRGNKATDIEKAVANIGLDELRCLLSASMLKSLLTARDNVRESVWSNSVAVGMLCRKLSSSTRTISPGEAFLAGLLHDVGKLIMIRRNGALYEKVFSSASTGKRSLLEAEEEVFELNHVEVGKWVAETWNFPTTVIEAIALHHAPWPTTETAQWTMPYLVKAADTIAHSIGVGHSFSMRSFAKSAEAERLKYLPKFGLSVTTQDDVIKEFQQKFEDELSLYAPEGG